MISSFYGSRFPAAFVAAVPPKAARMRPAGQVYSAGQVHSAGQVLTPRQQLANRLSQLGIPSIPDSSILPDDKIPDLLNIVNDSDLVTRFQALYCHPRDLTGKLMYDSDASRTAWMQANPWCPAPPLFVSAQTAALRNNLQTRLSALGYGTVDFSSLTDTDLSNFGAMSQANLQAVCNTGTAPWCSPPADAGSAPIAQPRTLGGQKRQPSRSGTGGGSMFAPPPNNPGTGPQPIQPTTLCLYPANPRAGQPGVNDNYFPDQGARDQYQADHPGCSVPPFHPDTPQPPPGAAPDCTLPANADISKPGVNDPYFATQAAHDAWATAHPSCSPAAFIPNTVPTDASCAAAYASFLTTYSHPIDAYQSLSGSSQPPDTSMYSVFAYNVPTCATWAQTQAQSILSTWQAAQPGGAGTNPLPVAVVPTTPPPAAPSIVPYLLVGAAAVGAGIWWYMSQQSGSVAGSSARAASKSTAATRRQSAG